jgi:hypothetical protein
MEIIVRGALRFKHKAGLEKGLTAFDAHAHPEFFKSELWSVAGPYALCERKFEIKPNCDHVDAFLAMAREAVEGVVYLRKGDNAKEWVRITKVGRPVNAWLKFDESASARTFAADADAFEKAWAAKLQQAKAADATQREKGTRKQAKSKSANATVTVVRLPANPAHVVAMPDGSLAVAAGTKIYFLAASGELLGDPTETQHETSDIFHRGMSALTTVPDGRVVGFQELADEARIARRGDAKAARIHVPERASGLVRDGSATMPLVLRTTHSALVIDDEGRVAQTLTPWASDFVHQTMPYRGGMLVSSSAKTAWFDDGGTKRFDIAGALAFARPDGIFVTRNRTFAHAAPDDGRDVRSMMVGSIAAHGLHGDRLFAATQWPSELAAWDITTGARNWVAPNILESSPGGIVVTPKLVAAWSPPPYMRQQDTSIVVYAHDGTSIVRLSPEGGVLGVVALGDDTLAAWVEGRTAGTKVHVWRDITTKPKLELLGHTGGVRGVLVLGDRLVSWAADKTVRIWPIASSSS